MNSIRKVREQAGLTQDELARLSGVAQPNIAAYESGSRSLSEPMRRRLLESMKRPSEIADALRDEIRAVVTAHHGFGVLVFGSTARGLDRPGSDLDLLVTLDPAATLFDLGAMYGDLAELLPVPFDLIHSQGLDPVRHQRILAEAREL